MNNFFLIALAPVLVIIELGYFKMARSLSILDKPNDRSLHERPTIRGGGIIFPLALVFFYGVGGATNYLFLFSLLAIAAVGFLDDLMDLSRLVRFGVQAVAMLLVFYELHIFAHALWVILILWIVAIGTINAYNFMDGINGITSGYSFVVVTSLLFVNNNVITFVDNDLLFVMMIALVVFSFFNFRKKAICFAGDVGSLSIGFGVLYLILKLIMVSHNYIFVLFLAVYGVDSVLTIVHRLLLKQNIFKAHRLHLYQVIISEKGAPHLLLTISYMIAQLIVNSLIIFSLDLGLSTQYLVGWIILFILGLVYLLVKRSMLKSTLVKMQP